MIFRSVRRYVLPLILLTSLVTSTGCVRAQNLAARPEAPSAYDAATLFGYNKALPLLATEQAGADVGGYKTWKISYYSINNQQVPAVLVLPTVKEGEHVPCVIVMHGLGQKKEDLAVFWPQLAKEGYAVFAIDAQFHGERKKMPLELFGSDPYSTRDLLRQTVVDLRRAIDYLETRKEIDPRRIGYLGFSMGGILGSMTAAVDSRIQAPILALAGGDWKLMFENSKLPNADKARKAATAESTKESLKLLDPVDPIHWVRLISPRPVLFINGDRDTIVPVVSAKALQDAAGPEKEIFPYKGDHVPPLTEFPRVLEKIRTWLNSHLK